MFQTLWRRPRNGDRGVEATKEARPIERPSIGLALGGGAARGFAHIGILRTLAAHHIVPDVIVGTSIGAVAGACFAVGQLDSFEQWARGLTRRGVLGYLDVSLSGSGLIGGDRLAARLEQGIGNLTIEELAQPFAAITTEVETGHEIWLTRGRLVDALRASYALPGIFPPVRLGGRWLVDGALVNPVPVSAARALGARLVIAINLNADLFGRGTIIASHGTDDDDERFRIERAKRRPGLFGLERALKRQFLGDLRPSRHLDGDGRSLEHHAGSHHAGPPRGRSAGCADLPSPRSHWLVRFPSRGAGDRTRRAGRTARARTRSKRQPVRCPASVPAKRQTCAKLTARRCECNRATHPTRARSRRCDA